MFNNVREIFTEDEWNAIYDAMADYQDHGENETELAYTIQAKITELFSWIMSRKDLAQRFRHLMDIEGYSFKEDYQEISELWRDYIDFMLELGNIDYAKHTAVYNHYWCDGLGTVHYRLISPLDPVL